MYMEKTPCAVQKILMVDIHYAAHFFRLRPYNIDGVNNYSPTLSIDQATMRQCIFGCIAQVCCNSSACTALFWGMSSHNIRVFCVLKAYGVNCYNGFNQIKRFNYPWFFVSDFAWHMQMKLSWYCLVELWCVVVGVLCSADPWFFCSIPAIHRFFGSVFFDWAIR